ncbi:TonB-dependent receptor [Flammeovirgaceae bacterium SG7u.111]|nr:TonB-dependent receptor [Flammeovirgaceae bacterium SG7u.132]WPO34450.1 TonB-dependent receptor [Flammeovirgaceae bacterium SG7u.111]
MNKTFNKKLLKISRNLLFGLIIKTLMISIVFASDHAKAQKLHEVIVTINEGDVSLKKSFGIIESRTDFTFAYEKGTIPLKAKVNIDGKNTDLQKVLEKIALDAKVSFKRINDQIVVKPSLKKVNTPKVMEVTEEITITGTVKDAADGSAIPGASILVKGTTIGTVTDFDGKFKMSVEEGSSIIIAFVGYTTQEIEVGNQTSFDISLVADLRQLEEVLIVGYGSVDKKNMTGAAENVKAVKEIASRPITNVGDVLQGNVAGVTVINTSGDPTAAPLIRVRGVGTLNEEQPLYVVDGVVNAPMPNPGNIAKITILKDAASASIYGARASAGVILVETKQGGVSKPQVTLDAYAGTQQVWKKLDALNAQEYADVMNLAFDNAGIGADDSRRDYIDPAKNPDGLVTRTNWMDEVFQTGAMQNYDLSVSGGSEKGNYYTALGYRKVEGTLKNTESERFSLRLNSSYKLSKKITVGENFSMSYTDGNYGANTTSGYTGAIITAIYYPPSASVWEDEEAGLYGGVTPRSDLTYAGSYGDLINPVASLDRLDHRRPTTTFYGNVYLDYEVIEGLSYKFNGGLTRINENAKNFTSKILEPGKIFNFNQLDQSSSNTTIALFENTLSYDKTINSVHNFNILAGYTVQMNSNEWFSASARGFDREDASLRYLQNGSENLRVNGGASENRLTSALARLNYSYKDKYLLTGIVRRDGTSKLAKDKRFGVFPSVSAAWRISDESFMSDVSIINDLKLRASWGEIGNLGAIGDYYTVPLVRTRSLLGDPASFDNYFGYKIDELIDPDKTWETTVQSDLGIDLEMLNSKVSFTADYFVKTTKDMLLRLPVNGTAGVSNGPIRNVGEMENRGFELTLGFREFEKAFKYELSANITSIKNEVLVLGKDFEGGIGHGDNVRGVLQPLRTDVGQPAYSFHLIETDGIFQTEEEINNYKDSEGNLIQPLAKPGDLKFIDQNGDGAINLEDKVFKGSAFPKFSYGFNARFEYKNFDLTMFFQGVSDVTVFNGLKFSTLKPTQGYNMLSDIKGAWSPENTGSDIPRLSLNDNNNNFGTESDWYLEDASYLRLKNLTIGYNLPATVLEKAKISKFRLYFTGTNLLTFTDYSGMDPELIVNHGIDMGRYPQSRSFIVGLNLGF